MQEIEPIHILGGVHGNERIGVHLVQEIKRGMTLDTTLRLKPLLGNIDAIQRNSCYITVDLNQQFKKHKQANPSIYEVDRALEIEQQMTKSELLVDLHSTTSNMGVSFIFSEWTPVTQFLASLLLKSTPNSFILYETEFKKSSAIVSPLAITLEVSSIGQGQASYDNYSIVKNALENILKAIEQLKTGNLTHSSFIYYQTIDLRVDFPRDDEQIPLVFLHPKLTDYQTLELNS